MFSLNRVNIIGYQTQPVEVRQTPGGSSVTDLNIVVPYSYQAANGEQLSGKAFHTVTLWGPMADVAGQYVRPGAQLFISGRLQTDSWEDEQGEKRSKTKIVALDMILLDPKDGQLTPPAGASSILGCVNRADVVGHTTRDPELRTTTSGQQVLTLGVATNERWKDKSSGEMQERTEYHNVVIWGDLAEQVSQNVKKGQRVFVSGRVQTRSWETQSGAKRYTTEIIAEDFSLLGVQNPSATESVQADATPQAAPVPEPESAPASDSPASTTDEVPSVDYQSEVKAEDLPF